MKRNLQKISITIDPELLVGADKVAARLGISRSALIADCLADNLQIMQRLLDGEPLDPISRDVLRLRGESADIVRERLDQLKGMADDLFARK